jgi:hypothetical protein
MLFAGSICWRGNKNLSIISYAVQIMVGDDEYGNAYNFTELDVVSEYVGEQLWIHHSFQMIANLQAMFRSSPNRLSKHLFEIYGHRVFSVGGRTLICRCLESSIVTEMMLDALHSQRITFGKDTIPTAEDLLGNYYESTDDDTFPAIDSLSPQGMFQFTGWLQPNVQLAGFKCYKDCATCTTNRNSTLLFLHISLQPLRSRLSKQ